MTALMQASSYYYPIFATENEYKEVIVILIDAGADINVKNKQGRTALSMAVEEGHCILVEALLKAEADFYVVDNDGKTVFDIAEELHEGNNKRRMINLLKTRERWDNGRRRLSVLLMLSPLFSNEKQQDGGGAE